MQIIFNEKPLVSHFVKPSDADDSLIWSQFVLLTDVEDGCLAWNSFTCSLILIPNVTANEAKNNYKSLDCVDELRQRLFLVSDNVDELKRLSDARVIIDGIDVSRESFVSIFTTFACNARCFYCYESKIPISSMSEETAHNTARFLINNYNDKPYHIRWFGGEPMVNSKAIDIICEDLAANEIPFFSGMVSNAYLFDEEIIKCAVEKWHLCWIQITLDGTQDVYNEIKNYVNDDGNAFERVMRNIQTFTENKVKVNARFNVSDENVDEYVRLIDVLDNRFKDNDYFYAYPRFLFDYYKTQSKEQDEKVTNDCNYLFDILEERGMINPPVLRIKPDATLLCAANSDTAFKIMPNGILNKCHHVQPLNTIGDVVTGIVDEELSEAYKETLPYKEKCMDCYLAPNCAQLKRCIHRCNDVYKKYNMKRIEVDIRTYYKYWKRRQDR